MLGEPIVHAQEVHLDLLLEILRIANGCEKPCLLIGFEASCSIEVAFAFAGTSRSASPIERFRENRGLLLRRSDSDCCGGWDFGLGLILISPGDAPTRQTVRTVSMTTPGNRRNGGDSGCTRNVLSHSTIVGYVSVFFSSKLSLLILLLLSGKWRFVFCSIGNSSRITTATARALAKDRNSARVESGNNSTNFCLLDLVLSLLLLLALVLWLLV